MTIYNESNLKPLTQCPSCSELYVKCLYCAGGSIETRFSLNMVFKTPMRKYLSNMPHHFRYDGIIISDWVDFVISMTNSDDPVFDNRYLNEIIPFFSTNISQYNLTTYSDNDKTTPDHFFTVQLITNEEMFTNMTLAIHGGNKVRNQGSISWAFETIFEKKKLYHCVSLPGEYDSVQLHKKNYDHKVKNFTILKLYWLYNGVQHEDVIQRCDIKIPKYSCLTFTSSFHPNRLIAFKKYKFITHSVSARQAATLCSMVKSTLPLLTSKDYMQHVTRVFKFPEFIMSTGAIFLANKMRPAKWSKMQVEL